MSKRVHSRTAAGIMQGSVFGRSRHLSTNSGKSEKNAGDCNGGKTTTTTNNNNNKRYLIFQVYTFIHASMHAYTHIRLYLLLIPIYVYMYIYISKLYTCRCRSCSSDLWAPGLHARSLRSPGPPPARFGPLIKEYTL